MFKFFVDPSLVKEFPDWFKEPRPGDVGFDLRVAIPLEISPDDSVLVGCGVYFSIPHGFVGLVRERSSSAVRGLRTSGGVIDPGYRGEIKVNLSNVSKGTIKLEKGERVAQVIILPCIVEAVSVLNNDELGTTERGVGGFGSTGRI
jgi:dUTP pyrophosphatase